MREIEKSIQRDLEDGIVVQKDVTLNSLWDGYIQNKTELKLIQEIMGHADITTTMDVYNESNTSRKKASFERLEGAFKIS